MKVHDITYPDQWYCPPCVQSVFVYNHYDDNDCFHNAVIEGMLDCSFQYHEMNNKVFMPFEINEGSDTPFTEIDPDFHFYTNSCSIKHTKCDYFIEDTFIDKFTKSGSFDRNLSVFHLNVKSLPKHYDELEMYLDSLRFPFSFIGLTETWLGECKENLYELPHYVSVTKSRNSKRGGGVSLLIRRHIPFVLRNDLAYFDSEMESVFIEIEKSVFHSNANIIMGVVYRMPDSSVDMFNERLADILNSVHKENKLFYLLGDLNIDLFKHDVHRPTSEFLDTIYSYNVYPLVTKPTRVTASSATLIDHILSNNIDVSYGHTQGILCTSISDHFAVFHIAGNMSTSKLTQPVSPKLTRDMRRKNIETFSTEMQKINWNNLLCINDTQSAYSTFHKMLSDVYDKCFPYKKFDKPYYNKKPWLTLTLKESIKTKNKLYVTSTKGSNKKEKSAQYKLYRNRLHHLLRSAERKYYHDLLVEHKSNLKQSWKIIKSVINRRKYHPLNSKFKYNGKVIDDGFEISNRFNKFFVHVGESLASIIPQSTKMPSDYLKHDIVNKMYLDPVTENEIDKIILNFRESSAGWDELKPTVIKSIRHCISLPLRHICNLSFRTGIFPDELKIANVVPIFKSGDEMIFSNYRPVSVLPVFSKIIERLMYNRLLKYINDNNLLYKYQFGFQKGRSTHMALIILIDKISEALENGDCVIGIFLDFSKAFDTVDHIILLQKMYLYGIQDTTLSWFENYLSNRKQYVTYNGIKSQTEKINCGVPQGSILGPLLFLIYINDLSTVSEACMSILFADDTNMFFTGKNLKTMATVINEELIRVQEWLHCNKLSLNVLKTHYMIFTSRNKCVNDVDIRINDAHIERVYATKFLGVQIDAQLTWKKHIEYTCKKLSKCVGILAKARRKLHKSSLLTLYYSFAFPYFIYCNHGWGNTYQTNLKSLVLVQKKLVRIISCAPFKAHAEPLMFAMRLLSVNGINQYMTAILMYQCLHCNTPNVFNNFFQKNNTLHGHDTRQADHLHVPYARLDIRKFCFKIHGANTWNNIPIIIKQSPSLDVFKQRLRHHLIESKSVVHSPVNWAALMTEMMIICPPDTIR